MLDLGTLGGATAEARGINNSGRVVGVSATATGIGGSSGAYAINNSDQVVGTSSPITGPAHAFRTTPGGVIDASADLGTLFSGYRSTACAINDAGNAVGYGFYSSFYIHAFFVPAGRAILPSDDLGTLPGGLASNAFAINNSNVIVGVASTAAGDEHAVIWTAPGTAPIDLNSYLPADSGWVLEWATGINDAGQITGYGTFGPNPSYFTGFILTPTPEPASLTLLIATTPLLFLRRLRRG